MISGAQVSVLSVLEPGGILSISAVMRSADVTYLQARTAVLCLQSAGLIVSSGPPSRNGYQITNRGRLWLSTRRRKP